MRHERNNLVWNLLDRHLTSDTRDNIAVFDDKESITYYELYKKVNIYLIKHETLFSTSVNSRVLCLSQDSIQLVVAILAIMRCGLVPCIVNPDLPITAYNDYLDTASPAHVLVSESYQEKFLEFLTNKHLSCISLSSDLQNIFLDHEDSFVPLALEPLADAFGVFTSGTTGNPNLVVHRHQDPLITNKTYVSRVLNITPTDKLFSTSKLFFAYGLNSLFYALMNGASAILSPRDNSLEKISQVINRHKPSIFFSVPTMYLRLLEHHAMPIHIQDIRLCISAGEHLPSSLIKKWRTTYSSQLIDGIGTTEILSTFISNTIEDFCEGSTGKVVPGFTVEIRDEENHVLPAGEIGILWVKGDTYPNSYFTNTDISSERFINGWFKTCDLFSCDSQGFYYYHGRASELIKCGGIWIFPYRIERILNNHPCVLESLVIGEYQQGLLRPVANVVLRRKVSDITRLAAELKNECKKFCSKHEYPHRIYFVDHIPKTATGKLQRLMLKRGT